AFVTLGVGNVIGSWLSGVVVEAYQHVGANGVVTHDWRSIWLVPSFGSLAVLVLFALVFRPRVHEPEPAEAAALAA
ncbi:MAG TPA: hypothetical protein VGT98_00015, partial [Candidatus Elarobacter sp.]|nr:hypothetical protein [Candidatus Elarobacter sp.]